MEIGVYEPFPHLDPILLGFGGPGNCCDFAWAKKRGAPQDRIGVMEGGADVIIRSIPRPTNFLQEASRPGHIDPTGSPKPINEIVMCPFGSGRGKAALLEKVSGNVESCIVVGDH